MPATPARSTDSLRLVDGSAPVTAGEHDSGPVQVTEVTDVTGFGGWRRRRHGARVPFDRDELERSGWRTTLEYRENHVRRRDGRLDQLEEVWRAEAERTAPDGSILVVTASAHSAAKAWARLRREADLAWCNSRPVQAPSPPERRAGRGLRFAPAAPRRRHVIAGASP